ncbi:MAG: amidohydrolase [Planctomycetaceae bacterium]
MPGSPQSPPDVVARCQTVMAHAWMVRTFVKHSEEVDDFPELMGIVRGVFDTSRALETRVDDPAGYLKMLRKKIGKLRKAAEEFRGNAALASTHTNFHQAVISMDACVDEFAELLQTGEAMISGDAGAV